MAVALTLIASGQSTSGASQTWSVGAGGVPSGAAVVVCVAETGTITAMGSCSDSASNSYGADTSVALNNTNSNGWLGAYHAYGITALVNGNTVSYTKKTSGNPSCGSAMYLTGILTGSDPIDTAVTAHAYGSSATPTVTSGTPAVANEMFIAAVSSYATSMGWTQDSTNASWATPPNNVNPITAPGIAGGHVINSGTGTLTYAPSITNKAWAEVIVAFKPAVGGFFRGDPMTGLGCGGPFFRDALAGI